jgi:hypothetical protein
MEYDFVKPVRFIHIKKNGGTSVYKFLRKNEIKLLIGLDTNFLSTKHYTAKHFTNEDSFKICIVRNPFTRLVSFYNWIKRNQRYTFSFDAFINQKFNIGRAKGAWNLQCEYMLDQNNNLLIDKIFKFETMQNELKNYFKINAKFPHLNKSTHDNHLDYYTNGTKEIVKKHFAKDFELLGY